MKNDKIFANILSARIIPRVHPEMAKALELKPEHKSLLIFTNDIDDVAYIAIDEATKECAVDVVYGESMWAGAANANSPFAGDGIYMLAGPNPDEVKNAFKYIQRTHETVYFTSMDDKDSDFYLSWCVSRSGSYLSGLCEVPEGTAIAYCVGAPIESMYAVDVALKAADVKIGAFFGPPSPTNYGGALFIGSQSACQAACAAYSEAAQSVVDLPIRV